MKKSYLLIALVCLCLPILARGLWFYQGIYLRIPPAQAPDYEEFTIPVPALSTPVAIEALAEVQQTIVLFDQSHSNSYSLPEVDPLTNAIMTLGGDVRSLEAGDDFEQELKLANALVLIAPTADYSEKHIQLISDFVQRGGRLLVVADPTRTSQEYYSSVENSVLYINHVLEPYNLTFQTDYIYSISHNEGNFRNVYVQPDEKTDLTVDVATAVFYGAHTIMGQQITVLKGDETTLSSSTDLGGHLSVAALALNQRVLALGDMAFITAPFNQVEDNFPLVVNIARFLVGSPRTRTLADFPNLFTRPVVVLKDADFDFSQDLLAELADLQLNYSEQGITFGMAEAPQSGSDLLVMGLYPPSADLQPYTDAMGINFNGSPALPTPTLMPETQLQSNQTAGVTPTPLPTTRSSSGKYYSLPGFGQVPMRGFSFILFSQTEERNTLILLAESQDDLLDLLKMVNNGSLLGCMLQDQVAVCPGGFVSQPPAQEEVESSPTPEPTLMPESEGAG